MALRRAHVLRVSRASGNKYAGQGAKKWEDFPQQGQGREPHDTSAGWSDRYKRGARKGMRVKMPKPRPLPMIDLMEMEREDLAQLEAYDQPIDHQHQEAAELRAQALAAQEAAAADSPAADADAASASTTTDLVVAGRRELAAKAEYMYPPGIELETHPHKPQRRVFRYYEDFQGKGREHFPASGMADHTPSHYFQYYRDHRLGKYENQLTLPRSVPGLDRSKAKRGKVMWGYHNQQTGPMYRQSPAAYIGSSYWVRKGMAKWRTRTWDPLATTWDMMLDEPTNPLLAAPHGRWESLPLDAETMPPDEMRVETGTKTLAVSSGEAEGAGGVGAAEGDFAGGVGSGVGPGTGGAAAAEDVQTFTVSPNSDLDVFRVSTTPLPGHFSKQFGMPMQKTIGPIQWQDEVWKAEKLHRAEAQGTLVRDEAKGGQDMRILCVGDSLTLGLSYGNDEGAVYKREAWLHREHEELMPRYHPYAKRLHELTNAHIDVLGVHRDTTVEMRDRLWRRLQDREEQGTQYDLVIIWGGVWDLFSPKTTADEVAQNLFRMHHVCHMHGAKTVGLTLPQVAKKPLGQFVGTRMLDINKMLEEFARDRRKQMTVCDVYRLVPYRSNVVSQSRAGDGSPLTKHVGRVGPVWKTGDIEFSMLGYDRVGELVYKTLKHRPGFLPEAVESRFSDAPCYFPTDRETQEILSDHEFKYGSQRKTFAHNDMYGSVYHTKISPYKDPEAVEEPMSTELELRNERAIASARQIRTPVDFNGPHERVINTNDMPTIQQTCKNMF